MMGRGWKGPLEFPFTIHGLEFQSRIAQGTYSTAFKVYSSKYDRQFCAKMTELDESFFDAEGNPLDPELAALLTLDNPNVIRCYRYFRVDGLFFLVLELCESGTLGDKIELLGAMNSAVIRVVMHDVLNGLVFCHDQGVAHRDIKPHNIFFDKMGYGRVGDFGLSSCLRPNEMVTDACGTGNYAAPEIYQKKEYDPFKADVWALGVTLYEMATGKVPWPDEAPGVLEFPDTVHSDLVKVITSMLQIDASARPTLREVQETPFFGSILPGELAALRTILAAPKEAEERPGVPRAALMSPKARVMSRNGIICASGNKTPLKMRSVPTFPAFSNL